MGTRALPNFGAMKAILELKYEKDGISKIVNEPELSPKSSELRFG